MLSAPHTLEMEMGSMAATSSMADFMVKYMLVPVSPSGTGNTFNELILSFFFNNCAVAD
ncbi:hypothetical protein SDC9_137110 [bioreactor metagenome]|uniref:Uncharacterized protein n=1 Tax=bioreactor metagenome TaxID=1076179 RepID=A0A645DKM1_9ZZZZ